MTETICYSKYVRISPRKVSLVAKAIAGLSPALALEQLAFLKKGAAKPLAETLRSAIANAESNLKIAKENLRIKSIEVGSGSALKRFRAVSRGTAHQYKRRTAHIKVVLEEIGGGKSGSKNTS